MRKYEEVGQPEHGLQSRRVFTWTAGPEDVGRPVRDIILYKWKLVSHDVARAKYETDHGITVNGETVFVDRRLREGDTLRVVLTDCAPEKIVPTDEPIEIVYEDEDLICLKYTRLTGILRIRSRTGWLFIFRRKMNPTRSVR